MDMHFANFHGHDEGQRIIACGRIELRCAFAHMKLSQIVTVELENASGAAKKARSPAKVFRVIKLPFSM